MSFPPILYYIINVTSCYFNYPTLMLGCDVRHSPMLEEIAASQGVKMKGFSLVHLMISDPSNIPELISR